MPIHTIPYHYMPFHGLIYHYITRLAQLQSACWAAGLAKGCAFRPFEDGQEWHPVRDGIIWRVKRK
jgi:hypothetical protein